jgi:alpha-amylase/alpha-mannosidase (GH57 family)
MADLAFLWHMHQPDYRHPETGDFLLPWVLLHAIKDYADMAGHLELHPEIRCTVNFVPVLLDQIEDYADQFATGRWRDPLLRIAAHDAPDRLAEADRRWLLDIAFRCHAPTMLEPFAPYRRLRDLCAFTRDQVGAGPDYLSGQYFADLATWYLLVWTGETLRRECPTITALMAKGDRFTLADRECLLAALGGVVRHLIPRYRALGDREQIELSCTPAAHPLAPLLIDFSSAREAWPDCPLPGAPGYPDGPARVDIHLQEAARSHEARFDRAPAGLWPAEGALSAPFLEQVSRAGFAWTASSFGVLKNSTADETASPYRPWRAPAGPAGDLTLFFRDERLSDLIGFEYARWHSRDAARHFVAEAAAIARADPEAVIPIFLDGENAWEYYPYNGWYFFEELYALLSGHAGLNTATLGEAALRHRDRRLPLPRLTAGSWVFGTFSTWIGSPDKNRAWDLLCEAKLCVDRALDGGGLSAAEEEAVKARLLACESSDWFWWFGDYNPAESVACFDMLFRENLKALYRLVKLSPPVNLDHPVSRGGGPAEGGGTMRRAT